MKIVLLKDLHKVGRKYDVVEVADGYALNNLIPAKTAEAATPSNISKYSKLKDVEMASRKALEEEVVDKLDKLVSTNFVIHAKANEQGHLFASIHKEEIAQAVKEQAGVNLDTDYIDLATALKQVGTFEIPLKVRDISKVLTVEIVALTE